MKAMITGRIECQRVPECLLRSTPSMIHLAPVVHARGPSRGINVIKAACLDIARLPLVALTVG